MNEVNLDLIKAQLRPSIHPSYARLFVAFLSNKGLEDDILFAGNSLKKEDLVHGERFVSYDQFYRLYLNAIGTVTGVGIALEASSLSQSTSHGPLGFGALAAPNVREMFNLVRLLAPTRIDIISIDVVETPYFAKITVTPAFELGGLSLFVGCTLLGAIYDLVIKATGREVAHLNATLPMATTIEILQLEKRFPDIEFSNEGDEFSIEVPLDIYNAPCMTADEYVFRNAQREYQDLVSRAKRGGTLSRQVKTYLHGYDAQLPSQESTSAHYSMSVRTFIRKLKAEDTSYQSLLDEVRRERASWLLVNTDITIEQLAIELGYRDTSNLSRVFKRWYECTPSKFRQQALRSLPASS